MIGDVGKAEKYFWEFLIKSRKDNLLKRLNKIEAQNLKGDNLVKNLTGKFEGMCIEVDTKKLEKLLGNSGIFHLLSTRPHTTSNSNFVKLVKTKVVNNGSLKEYLKNPSATIPDNIKNIRASLIRYLKLTENDNEDEIPEGEKVATDKLKRNKNKDIAEKMQSQRKANRLKVMATAYLIYLIDNAKDIIFPELHPGGSTNTGRKGKNSDEQDLIRRFEQGQATAEEFKELEFNYDLKSKLTKLIIPQGVGKIPSFMFEKCTGLKEVTISNSVASIKYAAFKGCTGLESVVIQGGVKSIDFDAFSGCTSLKTVEIPSSVNDIKLGAFEGCPKDMKILGTASEKIKNIVLEQNGFTAVQDDKRWSEGRITKEEFEDLRRGSIAQPPQLSRYFKIEKRLKKVTKLIIPEGVIELDGYCFREAKNLKEIVIPSSVKTLKGGFFNLANLETVTILEGVREIDSDVFKGCTTLKKIIIPGSLQLMGMNVFEGCTSLESVTIKAGAKQIGTSAFKNCTNLKEITIPGSVKKLGFGEWPGYGAFEGCTKLQKVRIENGVTCIGYIVFKDCTGLREVTIPDGIDRIGVSAFEGCVNLPEITIPGSVKTIDVSAFENCSNLATVTIQAGVRKLILKNAFKNCKSLKKLVLPPNNIWPVDEGAFAGCPKDMTIEGLSESMDDQNIYRTIWKQINGFGGRRTGTPQRPQVSTHYYSDFVAMFTKMEKDKDYTDESMNKLYNIYYEHTTDFDKERKFVPIEKRKALSKRIDTYCKTARKSRPGIVSEHSMVHKLFALKVQLAEDNQWVPDDH